MDILPAIDLVNGQCVRLIQGQYHKQITYKDDPVAQAKDFETAGASWLHIVDLDGAKLGRPMNAETIARIAGSVSMNMEVGGGIRTEENIEQMLNAGVTRLILGTSAIDRFDWFIEMCHKFPHKLALGLDARGKLLATRGWLEEEQKNLFDFAEQAADLPLAAIIYTDISRDGMLSGPNLERTDKLAQTVPIPVIAAGGVTTVEDIEKLKKTAVSGAIIGRALYEGTIDLKSALEAAG